MTLELSNSTESPKLAVIVPVYKVEKYLPKCLDSIINQTYKNLQIICVDDGSPDKCGDILEEYSKKDSRIIVIHKENGGLSSARNAALDLLNKQWSSDRVNCPEFVTFVDSDDYIDLVAYEECLKQITNDIDVLGFGSELVSNDENPISTNRAEESNKLDLSGKQDLTDEVIAATSMSVCNKIIRTQIIFDNNIRFPVGLSFEDAYFKTVYLCHCKTILFDSNLYYKYLISRADSITGSMYSKNSTLSIESIEIVKLVLDYLKNKNLFNKKQEVFWLFFYHMIIKVALNIKLSKDDEKTIYSEAARIIKEEKHCPQNLLQKRYDELILDCDIQDSDNYSKYRLFRKKHRLDYDKYYILGIPVAKLQYSVNSKILTIVGLIKLNLS